ncbi:hypothetical protein HUU05_02900 [candidate division KSB1 bacterium]|nr:hypothetical protein [candidate division KSB1 bacterium]
MSSGRMLYHLMRADFLERTRRYSFLLTLGFVLYFAYLSIPPNHAKYATLQLAGHRGIYNSAWLGSQVAMLTTLFLSIAGFYLVKNTISRDHQTGVGQILAATPMSKTIYVLGKVLSNFAVLAMMVLVLIVATAAMQLVRAEDVQLKLWPLVAPFLFLTLPTLAIIAALAGLFEAIKPLRGGFGNVLFYFLWTFIIAGEVRAGLNIDYVMGLNIPIASMQAATAQAFPEYDPAKHSYSMGFNIKASEERWELKTFRWEGVSWTPALVFKRLITVGLALGLTLLAAFCFDRFDSSTAASSAAGVKKRRFMRAKIKREESGNGLAAALPVASSAHLTALAQTTRYYSFMRILRAEIKLKLKGVSRWWLLVALGLIVAGAIAPLEVGRQWLLPFAWIWPLLLWSKMGTRENLNRTQQLVFSAPHVLLRQFPAMWMAGVVIALVTGSGVLLRTLFAGEWQAGFASLMGMMFIPTLALAFGVWSGSSKLFEIIYLLLWYIGPMNRVPYLDFIGVTNEAIVLGMPKIFLSSTIVLLALAFWGRRVQMSRY